MIKEEKIPKNAYTWLRMRTQTYHCIWNFLQVFIAEMNHNIVCDCIQHKSGTLSHNTHVGLLQGKTETTEPQVSKTYLMASSPFSPT